MSSKTGENTKTCRVQVESKTYFSGIQYLSNY